MSSTHRGDVAAPGSKWILYLLFPGTRITIKSQKRGFGAYFQPRNSVILASSLDAPIQDSRTRLQRHQSFGEPSLIPWRSQHPNQQVNPVTNWVEHSETHANISTDAQPGSYKHQALAAFRPDLLCRTGPLQGQSSGEGNHGIASADGATLGTGGQSIPWQHPPLQPRG